MITQNQVKIYNSFRGDMDGLLRVSQREQNGIINTADGPLIASLIQDIHLVKNGLASTIFARELRERLWQNCDSEETINELNNTEQYLS